MRFAGNMELCFIIPTVVVVNESFSSTPSGKGGWGGAALHSAGVMANLYLFIGEKGLARKDANAYTLSYPIRHGQCTISSCGNPYKMQNPEDTARPENPNPKWPVAQDLIELQPSYFQENWDLDWLNTSSSKMAYLVGQLKELHAKNEKKMQLCTIVDILGDREFLARQRFLK